MKSCIRSNLTTVSISVFLGIIIVFSGFHALGTEWSEAQKEIWNLEKMYWECIINADAETYKNLLHENVVSMRSRNYSPNNKAEEILKIRNSAALGKPDSYEIRPLSIQLFNKVAIVCFDYEYIGSTESDSGRATHIWMNENSTWYLIGVMEASFNTLPFH
jgi:hypothetical protein